MEKGRSLFKKTFKDYKDTDGVDILFSIYGVFDSKSVKWSYYILSLRESYKKKKWFFEKKEIIHVMTSDICMYNNDNLTIENIKSYGKKVDSIEDGEKYLEEFKIKWESGSNDYLSLIRDGKLESILK